MFTGSLTHQLDERQYEAGFGPCMDAAVAGTTIRVSNTDPGTPYPEFSRSSPAPCGSLSATCRSAPRRRACQLAHRPRRLSCLSTRTPPHGVTFDRSPSSAANVVLAFPPGVPLLLLGFRLSDSPLRRSCTITRIVSQLEPPRSVRRPIGLRAQRVAGL